MFYQSTRIDNTRYTSSEVILKGLADDGGLLVPETIPPLNYKTLLHANYFQIGVKVLSCFLTDFSEESLQTALQLAYGKNRFQDKILSLVETNSFEYTLELWHGPTSAFKDYALMLMPHLLKEAKKINAEKRKTLILVATSGDTGKAALEGYKDVEGVEIAAFYPQGGTSEIQRLQMATQTGSNVSVYEIEGNFDDAQTAVKEAFSSKSIAKKLGQNYKTLTSANSINWGRLVPQIIYYFDAYIKLVNQGAIKQDEEINFCVPTGNFGNIMAGFYAKQMGLPIHKFICASNQNNVLTEFISTGKYDANRPFYKTSSPSMDILISSNLERLLYTLSKNKMVVANYYAQLSEQKFFTVDTALHTIIQAGFYAGYANDATVSQVISNRFNKHHYLCDPHTAVAYHVLESYQKETGDNRTSVVLATANPYKFSPTVLAALGQEVPQNEFDCVRKLKEYTGMNPPKEILALENVPVRFNTLIDKKDVATIIESL